MPSPLVIATLLFGLLSVALLATALWAVRQRRWIGMSAELVLSLLCLALAALAATLAVATQGYRALTREELAATVTTEPIGPERFRATFRFPDGREASYELAGHALYVEAHIVKWHPRATLLGLHTAYELSRVSGRYDRLADEQAKPRTIHALSAGKPVDVFNVARALAFLGPLVDAEYGSATFLSTRQPEDLELRVSTTGLLLRRVPTPPGAPSTSPAAR